MTQQEIPDSEIEAVFPQLCHIVGIRHGDKVQNVLGELVLRLSILSDTSPPTTFGDWKQAFSDVYHIQVEQEDLEKALQHLLSTGKIEKPSQGKYKITDEEKERVAIAVEASKALRDSVEQEWIESIPVTSTINPLRDRAPLWAVLSEFLVRIFRRHGAETISILPEGRHINNLDQPSLNSILDETIEQAPSEFNQVELRHTIATFFSMESEIRPQYLTQMQDGTFTYFALSVDSQTVETVQQLMQEVKIFLDTNFLFGLFDLHSNPMNKVSKHLLDAMTASKFPFKIYIHSRTVEEFKESVKLHGKRLIDKVWEANISKAIVENPPSSISDIELAFHRRNSVTSIDPNVFLNRMTILDGLFEDHNITLYNGKPSYADLGLSEDELKNSYASFVSRMNKSRSNEALEHDITLLATTLGNRESDASIHNLGAVFLTTDLVLHKFAKYRISKEDEPVFVLLPNQFLQLLRPLLEANTEFDAHFGEVLALPDFRTAGSEVGIADEITVSRVITYLNEYKNLDAKLAARVLADTIVFSSMKEAPEDDVELGRGIVKKSIDANIEQIEKEKKDLEQQIRSKTAELEKTQGELTASKKRTTAESVVNERTNAELLAERERYKDLQEESKTTETILNRNIEDLKSRVGEFEQEQYYRLRRKQDWKRRGVFAGKLLASAAFIVSSIVFSTQIFESIRVSTDEISEGYLGAVCSTFLVGMIFLKKHRTATTIAGLLAILLGLLPYIN